MTVPKHPEPTADGRPAVEQSILRLFLKKAELEWDERHPLFDCGLTIPQMKVLFTAARPGGARPSFIAERSRMAPPNVTTVLDRLSDRGLVYRAPDPDDGRATIVLLTEEGKRMVRAVSAARDDRVRQALDRLSDEEMEQLHYGLQAVVRELDLHVRGAVSK